MTTLVRESSNIVIRLHNELNAVRNNPGRADTLRGQLREATAEYNWHRYLDGELTTAQYSEIRRQHH